MAGPRPTEVDAFGQRIAAACGEEAGLKRDMEKVGAEGGARAMSQLCSLDELKHASLYLLHARPGDYLAASAHLPPCCWLRHISHAVLDVRGMACQKSW